MRSSTDSEWLNWVALQKQILRLVMINKDVPAALRALDNYLAGNIAQDLRRDAFVVKGRVEREAGNSENAKENYLKAHELSDEGTYSRYVIEITLGSIYEGLGMSTEALGWYTEAMRTAVLDPGTSGAVALEGFLDIKGVQSLSDEEADLCIQVVRQAWSLFRLPGEPDLEDLRGTIEELKDASTRPLPNCEG